MLFVERPHPHTSFQDLLDGLELKRRYSSSSILADSPAHSRHGGSPLHSCVPGKTPTQAVCLTHKRSEQDKSWLNLRCVTTEDPNDDPLAASTFRRGLINLEIVFICLIPFATRHQIASLLFKDFFFLQAVLLASLHQPLLPPARSQAFCSGDVYSVPLGTCENAFCEGFQPESLRIRCAYRLSAAGPLGVSDGGSGPH